MSYYEQYEGEFFDPRAQKKRMGGHLRSSLVRMTEMIFVIFENLESGWKKVVNSRMNLLIGVCRLCNIRD